MRVISCMIVLALLCFTGSGCSLFKKNNTGGTTAPANNGGTPPPRFPVSPDPLKNSDIVPPPPTFPTSTSNPQQQPTTIPASSSNATTILAGTVTDAYHRPIGNAYIRPINLEEKENGAPINVVTDASGHFIMQGVKPGARYKLIARTKQGDKILAGTLLTSAPNVRVVIPVHDDLAGANTPPMPGSPAYTDPQSPSTKNIDQNPFGTTWNSGQNTKPKPVADDPLMGLRSKPAGEPNLPATMSVPTPPGNTSQGKSTPSLGNPEFVPGIANNTSPFNGGLPPLNIGNRPRPNPLPNMPQDAPRPQGLAGGDSRLETGPTRVPSCVIVGSKVENMALRDTKGQVWEYRKQGYGKLVLMDFWGTYCQHCLETMPTLNRLQTQYGPRGLEVLGIAIEAGKDERKEADAVARRCTSLQIQYRQLLGRVGSFDVGKNFRVESVPTLILLNEQGDIIWHHVGRPDSALMNALERTIQSRLNNRTF